MKKILLYQGAIIRLIILFLIFQAPSFLIGQNLKISDFVLFGTNGVQLGASSNIKSGAIGSNSSVQTGSSSVSINGNIYSGGKVLLGSSNSITGNITAANSSAVSGAVLSVGSSATINGNIDVNGNITFGSSGKVSGIVTHPAGTTYTGPVPGGGNITGVPNLPVLPTMPSITTFPAVGTTNITSTQTITPGAYGNLALAASKTITLSGTGVYVFNSIKNGSSTKFIFDFKNDPTGVFKIYVYSDVDLSQVSAVTANGGDPTRIYAETHGNGSTCSLGNYSWNIGSGSGGWMGTVWAPYGGINIGSGQSNLKGAFYSGTQVNVASSVTIYYDPFTQCSIPTASAGADMVLNCATLSVQLDGTASTPGLQYNWVAINNGNIVSGATTLTPTVNAVGGYVLTVTNPSGGCSAMDTAYVTYTGCIVPYYPPPAGGKIVNLIGAELSSLAANFGNVKDTTQNIFILRNDSVMIEVIALQGQYQTLLTLLQTPAYGMTNLINNGPNTLIISGEYPINHLTELNSLTSLIDYARPLFPSISNVGIVTSQGDTSIQSYLVRGGYGLSGNGVKVGVISNS